MMTCQSSGELAASAVVAARPARLCAVTLTPAAANSTLIIYDNASAASGTILMEMTVLASAKSETISLNFSPEALKGLYASLSGASAKAVVHFALL